MTETLGAGCVYCGADIYCLIPPTELQVGALGSCPACDHDIYIVGECQGPFGSIYLEEDANFLRAVYLSTAPK